MLASLLQGTVQVPACDDARFGPCSTALCRSNEGARTVVYEFPTRVRPSEAIHVQITVGPPNPNHRRRKRRPSYVARIVPTEDLKDSMVRLIQLNQFHSSH